MYGHGHGHGYFRIEDLGSALALALALALASAQERLGKLFTVVRLGGGGGDRGVVSLLD